MALVRGTTGRGATVVTVPQLDRLIYVDDSGSPQSGMAVYGWIEFRPDRWASVLGSWLATRKRLWRDSRIPVSKELHTVDYVAGRARLADQAPERHRRGGVDLWKDFGREIAADCLETLRCTEGLTVGAVYRQGEPSQLSATKRQLYSSLIARFETELAVTDSLALVFMDGDGSDPSYRTAHRDLQLNERRVIEDAIHMDSRASQLVQMADLVAWSAHAAVSRHGGSKFAWDWYQTHLSERDPARRPLEL